ncbi:MAG: cation acetate symporter, partial [Bacteroidetes bacterium]|nr:cation acetate symporter [Bacteroidota bacterium]
GIFYKRMNKEGAVAGMVVGTVLMIYYMVKYKMGWLDATPPPASEWWFGISPEGFGSVAMLANFAVSLTISAFTPAPPEDVQQIVEDIRLPMGAGEATQH